MFGSKDKSAEADKNAELEKAPISFNNPISSVLPKQTAAAVKDAKTGKSMSTTLIARETELFGDIKFSGNLEIEGKIVGNITSNPSAADSSVRILENGRVEGDIRVPKAAINGDVKGNVYALTLELAAKAKIEGNVNYQSIEMVKGAQVNGSLVYSDSGIIPKPEKN